MGFPEIMDKYTVPLSFIAVGIPLYKLRNRKPYCGNIKFAAASTIALCSIPLVNQGIQTVALYSLGMSFVFYCSFMDFIDPLNKDK